MPEELPKPPPISEPTPENSELQVLKRQLYARDEAPVIAERTQRLSDLPTRRGEAYGKSTAASPAVFADTLAERTRKRQRLVRWSLGIGAGVLIFVGAVSATLWYRARHQLKNEQIALVINAPTEFTSGERIAYTIAYENTSLEAWQQVEVAFEPPHGFRFLESQPEARRDGAEYVFAVPGVPAGGKGEVTVGGILIGEQNSNALAKAEIVLAPTNDPKSRYAVTSTLTTSIRAVPIELSIDASSGAVQGERLLGVTHIRNTSESIQQGLYLALDVPPGMSLAVEDPQFSSGYDVLSNEWVLPTLKPLEELTRNVVFYVEGSAGERRALGLKVGIQENEDKFVQREVSQVVTVTASELSVEQVFNSKTDDQAVQTGEDIKGVVQFRNTGTVGLKNVVVKVQFQGVGFNPASLQLKSGAYDPTTKTITWTASTVPELANVPANQGGEVTYDFSVLSADQFPVTDDQGTNNTIVAVAAVDSPDIQTSLGQERRVVSDRTHLSVATDLTLDLAAFYDDGRLGLPSSGPVPPKVGEQTTYTLRFRLGSTLNDTGDVRLTAVLPDGVKYTGKTYLTTGEVDFNDRTGEVIWHMPLIKGLTGRTSPPAELHVQVAITPGENVVGQEIQFVTSAKAEGTDVFADQFVTTAMTDKFPTTETASPGKGKVQ